MPQVQESAIAPPRGLRAALATVGGSVHDHPTIWTCALLAAGLLVRIWRASGTFLNSDEAIQFAIANKVSWWQTYRANLSINAHPPLLVFLLHVWRHLGDSELMLRLPSILAGTAFCWFTFKWLSLLLEESAAWSAFVLLLFSSASIELSVEVRHYAIFLAFAMASAYLLESALERRSVGLMLASGMCLWLAICSHFSAFLFAAVLGVYAIWRMVKSRPQLRVVAAWELGQIIALGLCYFFYVSQFQVLQQAYKGSTAAKGWMADSYLAKYYFSPGSMNPLTFIVPRTGSFFQFAFGNLALGDLTFLAFLAGIVVLCVRQRFARLPRSQVAFLLMLPFAVNGTAALLHAYPYGGIRQCAFLLPVALAGIAVAMSWLGRGNVVCAMMVAAGVALCGDLLPAKQLLPDPPGSTRITNMKAAISFMQDEIPNNEPVLVDPQTSTLLGYYLCDRRPVVLSYASPDFSSYECGGHKVIVARHNYVFTVRGFNEHWQALAREYKFPVGSRVWVSQMGWNTQVAASFANIPAINVSPHFFGNEIQIFYLTVGQNMLDMDLRMTP
jgi:hypothetical protein